MSHVQAKAGLSIKTCFGSIHNFPTYYDLHDREALIEEAFRQQEKFCGIGFPEQTGRARQLQFKSLEYKRLHSILM